MDLILPIALGLVALGLGAALLWTTQKTRHLDQDLRTTTDRVHTLEADLETHRRTADERLLRVTELEAKLEASDVRRADDEARLAQMRETFDALAGKTLKDAQASFLQLANENFEKRSKQSQADLDARKKAVESLVEPIGKTLEQTRLKLDAIEKTRTESFATLAEQIQSMREGSGHLRDETAKLVKALARPDVRGRYGEIQLRRVVELAGMTAYCDFTEQTTIDTEAGRYRPDMVVRLPNDRMIVVDAKTNTQEYLDAAGATSDTERDARLDAFATHVAEQIKRLGSKSYWSHFDGSPEFTVMFVPGDQFIDAALSRRPDLLETAANHHIILASPSTLIGLLRAVHVGWHEQRLADDARELMDLGRQLHERAAVALGHAADLGKALQTATKKYNSFVGSVDSRLIPTLRKFEESGIKSGKEIQEMTDIDVQPRQFHIDEPPRLEPPADD